MKNLHILPTDKPSRLVKIYNDVNRKTFKLKLDVEVNDSFKEYVNIYITYDEEIKEGDWCYDSYGKQILQFNNRVGVLLANQQKERYGNKSFFKIILTTDQDLIKDGVQAIDDEFLEWFVKNPNCEEVKVVDVRSLGVYGSYYPYKIVIPKEEHKQGSIVEAVKEVIGNQLQQVEELRQETQGYICPQTKKQCDDECCVSAEHCHIEASFGIISDCEQPKQEIVEERKPYWNLVNIKAEQNNIIDLNAYANGVEDGVKWQQEQDKNLYSEEDLLNFGAFVRIEDKKEKRLFLIQDYFKKWFEQFSKLKNG